MSLDDLKIKKIVTYCSGGYRGNIAADELNKLGFDTVTIEGGYSAWKDNGKTLKSNSISSEWIILFEHFIIFFKITSMCYVISNIDYLTRV
ncbi:MAG TPA: rhodanese-like domain-containing protein [Candidatus Bathyarchaeia archaeon]|nr:rhodanese-like domain-containing protein [Candidatus Bathyarchaeia archaeon]